MFRTLAILCAFAALLSLIGCSNDAAAPDSTSGGEPGVFGGEIGTADFSITLETATGPRFPLQGPFVLRGRNLHYDDALGALVVDLTVLNRGIVPHGEPVDLTFVQLLPAGVTVNNPDNGTTGAGALIHFQFANDDGLWTPQEESLPRRIEFGVDKGVSIAFFAHLTLGVLPTAGTIGGVVWHDKNRDGMMDKDEPAMPRHLIVLESASGNDSLFAPPDVRRTTRTASDGTYRFDDLRPGHWVVGKGFDPPSDPTTANPLHVILVPDTSGGVSSFLAANFGCVPMDIPPPDTTLAKGDFVKVNGHYHAHPGALVALGVDELSCADDTTDGDGDDDSTRTDPRFSDDDSADDDDCSAKLRGPVTDVNEREGMVEIMGAKFPVKLGHDSSANARVLAAITPGDRVDARIETTSGGRYVVVRLRVWNGRTDQVHGVIEEVHSDSSFARAIRVLGVRVLLTR